MASPHDGSGPIRIVLFEPVGIVLSALRATFDAEPDFEVVGEAANADRALDVVRALRINQGTVALVGVELVGDHDAFWLIRAIRDEAPRMLVLATGTDLVPDAAPQALFAGADGFIHKNSTPERFVDATRRAAAGELVLEGLPREALEDIVGRENGKAHDPGLTERELVVLATAAEGLTSREIGRRLGCSERTVTTHLEHIYRKLGARGRVEALAIASRLDLMPTQDGHGGKVVPSAEAAVS